MLGSFSEQVEPGSDVCDEGFVFAWFVAGAVALLERVKEPGGFFGVVVVVVVVDGSLGLCLCCFLRWRRAGGGIGGGIGGGTGCNFGAGDGVCGGMRVEIVGWVVDGVAADDDEVIVVVVILRVVMVVMMLLLLL